MNKKYQVFISSTYVDLVKEREVALGAVLGLGHMPIGMELFPSTDNDPLRYIRGVIDNCDYYLLLVGGRYGSVADDGLSFTEKEFDYAVSKGLHVIAFVRDGIELLPPEKRDTDESKLERLRLFRTKVQSGRVARPWRDELQLQSYIYPSLVNAFTEHARLGWVRADQSEMEQAEYQIKTLSEKCKALEGELTRVRGEVASIDTAVVAGLDHSFSFAGTFKYPGSTTLHSWMKPMTFGEAFALVGPYLMQARWDSSVSNYLATEVVREQGHSKTTSEVVSESEFRTFQTQLQALGLIALFSGSANEGKTTGLAWSLTELGKKTVLGLRTVKPGA